MPGSRLSASPGRKDALFRGGEKQPLHFSAEILFRLKFFSEGSLSLREKQGKPKPCAEFI